MRQVSKPTEHDFTLARKAVKKHLQPTPLVRMSDNRWLKLEVQQPTGAFKVRGAISVLSRLPADADIVTASAGNHAIGIAWSAQKIGLQATIVVPETVSLAKLGILQEIGANIVQVGTSFDDAEKYALAHADEGAHYISAYNDPHVIAGQATILDELLDQIEGDFTVIVPVGGGGLISGIVMRAATVTDRTIRVIGVEAEASRAVSASLAAGRVVDVEVGETLADGLAGNIEQGSVTVDILREHPAEFLAVSETQIRAAIRELSLDHDLVAEGSAATSYAAMQSVTTSEPVVVLITGRNIATDIFQEIVR